MSEKFCVMNVKKQKRQSVKSIENETNRLLEEDRYKNAVDCSKKDENVYFVKSENWNKSISDILENEHIREKNDSVVLLTSIYAYSPEWGKGKSKEEILEYFEKCLEFEREVHGQVINAVVHFDETTPHMHVASVPVVDVPDRVAVPVFVSDADGNMVEKRDKKGKIVYKRELARDEQGNVKTHRGLNASYIVGNKVKMSKTQSEFYEHCGKQFGMSRGEIRVMDTDESKRHLTETQYKAQKIIEDAKQQSEEAMNTLVKSENEFFRKRIQVDNKLNEKQKQIERDRERLESERKRVLADLEKLSIEREKWFKMQNTSFQQLLKQFGWDEKVNMMYADAERYEKLKDCYEVINGWDKQDSVEDWLRKKRIKRNGVSMSLMECYQEDVENVKRQEAKQYERRYKNARQWLDEEEAMKKAFNSMIQDSDKEYY